MMFQPSPVELADLDWYMNQAEGDIKLLKSLLAAAIEKMQFNPILRNVPFRYSEVDEHGRTFWHGTVDVGLRCGPVEVKTPKGSGGSRTSGVNGKGMALGGTANEMDRRAVAAAGRYRRIAAGLAGADTGAPYAIPAWRCPAPPSWILRLRFREPMAACLAHGPSPRKGCRVPFGLVGDRGRRADTRAPLRDEVRLTPLRGAGAFAHLTDAARAAFACSRTRLDIERWLDRLGGMVCARDRDADLDLAREIRREAGALELQALHAYRAASVRVPERVRRAARARAAA